MADSEASDANWFISFEVENANRMLSENSVEWLSEYLVGNWFPIDDYCLYGDDALLSKLIESVLLCVLRSDGSEDEVEEIQPLYLGLTTRYKWSCDSAEDQSTFDQFLEVVITRACCLVSDRLGLHQHPRPDDPYGSENSSYLEEFAKHVLSSEGVRFDPLSKGRADAYLSENTVEELVAGISAGSASIQDLAGHCDVLHLSKLMEAVLLYMLQAARDDDEPKVIALIAGLRLRFERQYGEAHPKFGPFAELLSSSITQALYRLRRTLGAVKAVD